ncbi:hypothetical protein E3E11_01975 [Oecophyllibacter saccharovorans]|uniref:Uncharacterized protein n=1 Tax=Oecophyllibacter saccharovorans TaxID=2558360 RepID=A0A506URK2_9PROT|nr:hypothetical protein [Oecophyllibacter saccharovorans]QDH14832.1 hypothetical protein E3E11_01975 [Oecophyllibacter saccharovorans]TPW35974.1 hypothetical protein E3202_03400 [Oecophyllibacter saccharovorans]
MKQIAEQHGDEDLPKPGASAPGEEELEERLSEAMGVDPSLQALREAVLRKVEEKTGSATSSMKSGEEAELATLIERLSPRQRLLLKGAYGLFLAFLSLLIALVLMTGYSHWQAGQDRASGLHERVTHPAGNAPTGSERAPDPRNG